MVKNCISCHQLLPIPQEEQKRPVFNSVILRECGYSHCLIIPELAEKEAVCQGDIPFKIPKLPKIKPSPQPKIMNKKPKNERRKKRFERKKNNRR